MKIIAFLVLGLTLAACAPKLVQRVSVPPSPDSKYANAQVEPNLTIHPNDTSIIAAGAVLDEFYLSKNGGQTWEASTLKSPYGVYGDPVLTFDKQGRLYYFHLASYKKTSHLDRIICQYSDDLGNTWSEGSFPKPRGTKVQDKQWVTIDPANETIYMTWTQFDAYNSKNKNDSSIIVFAKSTDRGETWNNAYRISKNGGDCLDGDNTVEGAMPVVTGDGKLVVIWTGPKGLCLQESSDGGDTWLSEERILFNHENGWDLSVDGIYRTNGLPVTVSDPARNKVYLTWAAEDSQGGEVDVLLSYSNDNAQTWSRPKVIGKNKVRDQFMPWMDVDTTTGELFLIYYDRGKTTGILTEVEAAYSFDGGENFDYLTLTQKPFEPSSKKFFGDYLSISAHLGKVMTMFPIMENGKIRLEAVEVTSGLFK